MVNTNTALDDQPTNCADCGAVLNYDIHKSAAGYYFGSICPNCGPYARYTDYFSEKMKDTINGLISED